MSNNSFSGYDLSDLTWREIQVLQFAALGLRNEDIASEMNVSVALVKLTRAALIARYQVHNIIPLCVSAALQGLIN